MPGSVCAHFALNKTKACTTVDAGMSVFWSNMPKPVLQSPVIGSSCQSELEEVKRSLATAIREKDTCVAAAEEICPRLSECAEWKYTSGGLIVILCANRTNISVFETVQVQLQSRTDEKSLSRRRRGH